MRTTVDLPPPLHARAREIASQRHASMSSVLAELVARGLGQMDEPLRVETSPTTGLPVISISRRVTSEEVAEIVDDE
ncbi:hypothetical protein DEO23_09405 [Brachybacterium endophyticum]|uniref:Antitoxin n=1 Tax=Brachybacterium endophyticum TaxID=2182385 RepID=A0A2U2RK31_9MICO|nr:hypothetical protein [Brachybacterium endophyticum]PWH06227.1 hypothetical protein DEO23_09405 [Brachybacterium endophyticum]